MTGISERREPLSPTQEQQPSLPGLSVPDSSFRQVIHVVSDAGPLIQTLESGIPSARAIVDGLVQIPLACWTLAYSSEGSRALTRIEASPNSSGSQPFTVRLSRCQDFWGDDGKLESPRTSYDGSIAYALGGGEIQVSLTYFPAMLKEAFDVLESKLQEPAVRDARRASVEVPAATYAADMAWVKTHIDRHEEAEGAYLRPNLRKFLDEIAKKEIATWSAMDLGESYEYHGIEHAWMYTFENGEALVLARLMVSLADRYANNLGNFTTILIVGSRGSPQHRFHIILDHEVSLSEFHDRVWRLTRPPKDQS